MIRSETGSGKTLAYLLPIINDLLKSERRTREQGTVALVISPTRELCLQIYEVLKAILSRFYWIVPGVLLGGEKKKSEKARLRKGITILVATPGRLLDHLENTKSFQINQLRWMVLDEADRLLDLGFGQIVKQIYDCVNKKSQTKRHNMLISATLTKEVKEIAKFALENPIMLGLQEEIKMNNRNIVNIEELTNISNFDIPKTIVQKWMIVEPDKRLTTLIVLIGLQTL